MEIITALKLTSVDYFAFAILIASALVGIYRGFFKEVLALAAWFIAAWIAYHYSNYLASEWLSTFQLDEMLRLGLSFLILFILVLIACNFVGAMIQKIMISAGLSSTDRFLGLAFGLVRGALIVVVLSTLAMLTPIPQTAAWKDAFTRPAIDVAMAVIQVWLPADWATRLGAPPPVTPAPPPSGS
ncbi:MAG: CvpA family protein [Polynucleobacter sp.]|nr:CvpA family protein [Polynucleobacter sp.]MDZ4058389.1 CvpA family protein [Polynucleobacter sp.]